MSVCVLSQYPEQKARVKYVAAETAFDKKKSVYYYDQHCTVNNVQFNL